MKYTKLFFCLILILAGFLRLYNLGIIPPSLDWDETSIGYNAYSILTTGKDEYGNFLPFLIRSFGDYKPPLYTYLTIPSVAFFGLNEFAVRFPSAIFGIFAVFLTYFLVKELFKNSNDCKYLALTASLLLAISPWHLQFSRAAFEANTGVTLLIAAVYFFLKGKDRENYLPISFIFFALSLYAYHSLRVVSPLIFLSLVTIFFQNLKKKLTFFILGGLIGLILLIPFFITLPESLNRAKGVSKFSEQIEILKGDIQKIEDDKNQNNNYFTVLHNRRLTYLKLFISGYLSHFDPNWLFLKGDNARHHAPSVGLLYYWELPVLLLAFYFFLKKINREKVFLLSWIFLAPVAAAFSTGVPHAIRSLTFLPTPQIMSAYGLIVLFSLIRNKFLKIGIVVIILINFLWYFELYHHHLNIETSEYWQYGYKEIVAESNKYYSKVSKIYVTNKYDQPYIYFLFYNKFSPVKYQSYVEDKVYIDRFSHAFDKYIFGPIKWSEVPGNSLVIGSPDEVPNESLDKSIFFLDGKEAFRIKIKR